MFRRCIACLALALALSAVHPGKSLGGLPAAGTITAVRGVVSLRSPGGLERRQAVRGDDIAPGDVVSTGHGARAQIALLDDTLISLAQDSSVRVNQFSFDPGINRRTAVIHVLAGTVRVIVSKVRSPESDVTVQTDSALITVPNLIDCVVRNGRNGSTVFVLDQSLTVASALPYVIGTVTADQNEKVVIPQRRQPSSPVIFDAGERRDVLRAFRIK